MTNGAAGTVIRWQSASNRIYLLMQSTNLIRDLFTNPLATNILANPPVNVYTDAPAPTLRFYRIKLK